MAKHRFDRKNANWLRPDAPDEEIYGPEDLPPEEKDDAESEEAEDGESTDGG